MVNFDYQTPTRLIFGKGVVAEKLASVMAQYGKRVLLTWGGGSIKRSGLYDQVKEILKDKEVFELSGIQPNPKYNPSVLEGVKICKEQHIDVILAVGGGSVIDCTKAIAAGACYDGDTWDLLTFKKPTLAALPIVDIITMAATGTEYDPFGVISRTETNDKIGYCSKHTYPQVSFIDPTYTFTLPVKQTLAGVADCINHIMESYFCGEHIMMNDAFMEGAIKSLVKNVKIVLEQPDNYEVRAEIFYATTLGCNGIYCLGNSPSGWPMHGMEHALSAFYDITHGEGLAIVTPHWMRYILEHTTGELHEQVVERCTSFGKNIFGTSTAEEAIDAIADFYKSIGIPMTLHEVGIDDTRIGEMAKHVAELEGLDKAWVPLHEEDIAAIYRNCL
ncbi:MAG: iron-containing alcohol dehydrogenase [Bacteroides sp.]|nr:iron-containing alcohol dehydrogenase [Bacteroides sp.]